MGDLRCGDGHEPRDIVIRGEKFGDVTVDGVKTRRVVGGVDRGVYGVAWLGVSAGGADRLGAGARSVVGWVAGACSVVGWGAADGAGSAVVVTDSGDCGATGSGLGTTTGVGSVARTVVSTEAGLTVSE